MRQEFVGRYVVAPGETVFIQRQAFGGIPKCYETAVHGATERPAPGEPGDTICFDANGAGFTHWTVIIVDFPPGSPDHATVEVWVRGSNGPMDTHTSIYIFRAAFGKHQQIQIAFRVE
jgi:hypothetical protein